MRILKIQIKKLLIKKMRGTMSYIKKKISLIFITLYFSFLSEVLITFYGENEFPLKYLIYLLLALCSFYIYRKIGEHTEEAISDEFFSSLFAISLVYLPIVFFLPVYSNWLFLPIFIFLFAYPFLYLNKCCLYYSQWYVKKRETSKKFRFWTIEPYDIEDTKRTFNFDNVYIGVLVTTIMYLLQLYTELKSSSVPMFFVYTSYLSYIFFYVLFIARNIWKKTFSIGDLFIVLFTSIFYMMITTYLNTDNKNEYKEATYFKVIVTPIVGNEAGETAKEPPKINLKKVGKKPTKIP